MGEVGAKKQILVPVDFSPCAEAAVVQACKLATCMGAGVRLLHVVHDPADMPGYYARFTKNQQMVPIQDAAAEMLADFVTAVKKRHHQVNDMKGLETLLVMGLPVSRILEVADKLGAEMIVMGSKGASGLKHLMIGSKAEQVIRLARVPVMIVKSPEALA